MKSGRLFHTPITRLLEKYLVVSIVQLCFDFLYMLPQVTVQPHVNSSSGLIQWNRQRTQNGDKARQHSNFDHLVTNFGVKAQVQQQTQRNV